MKKMMILLALFTTIEVGCNTANNTSNDQSIPFQGNGSNEPAGTGKPGSALELTEK